MANHPEFTAHEVCSLGSQTVDFELKINYFAVDINTWLIVEKNKQIVRVIERVILFLSIKRFHPSSFNPVFSLRTHFVKRLDALDKNNLCLNLLSLKMRLRF